MTTKIQKRDGREIDFDSNKITNAILRAANAVEGYDKTIALKLTKLVVEYLQKKYPKNIFTVEDVQDAVEKILIEEGHAKTAKAFILYRNERTRIRDGKSKLMDTVADILVETNRENANVSNSPAAKMLQIASALSVLYYLNKVIPEQMAKAHIHGDFHIHDLDFYGKTLTCLQIPLKRLLEKGFHNGHGGIRSPKRINSASALAAIILQSSQNDMHGGQSFAFFDKDMACFAKNADENETYQAMEALIYNLNSMHSRAGAQVPFSSINLGTGIDENSRKITRNLLLAYEKGLGFGETPIFPNIIFRIKKGVNFYPEDPNYDLFQLAIRVASKRLNPTFSFMDSSFNKEYGDQVSYMGCRTRVMYDRHGQSTTEGRGNLSFTTINVPRIAIKSCKNISTFYNSLEETMNLVAKQLHHRYKVQSNLKVRDMPFLMGQKLYVGSENLKSDDRIEEAIKHGTLSIGFIGLAETLIALTGKHHGESDESQDLGKKIVSFMRNKTDELSEQYDLNFTLLATPAEGLSGRFLKIDQDEYGVIKGITDKNYYTNSFHIPVYFPISIDQKLSIEGAYHKYTNAGHISYVEFDAPPIHNQLAIEKILHCMSDADIGYGGINFPIDFCNCCGFSGVISEHCPSCKGESIRRIRRITGYLSTIERFNDAKQAELSDRIGNEINK